MSAPVFYLWTGSGSGHPYSKIQQFVHAPKFILNERAASKEKLEADLKIRTGL